jgi:hypothetical protein
VGIVLQDHIVHMNLGVQIAAVVQKFNRRKSVILFGITLQLDINVLNVGLLEE